MIEKTNIKVASVNGGHALYSMVQKLKLEIIPVLNGTYKTYIYYANESVVDISFINVGFVKKQIQLL